MTKKEPDDAFLLSLYKERERSSKKQTPIYPTPGTAAAIRKFGSVWHTPCWMDLKWRIRTILEKKGWLRPIGSPVLEIFKKKGLLLPK